MNKQNSLWGVQMNNADIWGKIYLKLKQIDELKKFRKTVAPRQVLLDDAIARKLKEMKNESKRKREI